MSLLSGAHNTAKADMTGASVYRLRHARRRTITTAVVGGAQMRPTFDHLTRDLEARLLWVVDLLPFSAARICHGAAGFGRYVLAGIPVGRPFPNVADDVIE